MSDLKIGLTAPGNASLVDLKLRAEMQNMERIQKQAEEATKGGKSNNTAAMREAAQQFEGLLIQQMLKSMWETVPQGGLLTGSQEEQQYRDMLGQAYAEELSKGQGIGIKEVIYKEMEAKNAKPNS